MIDREKWLSDSIERMSEDILSNMEKRLIFEFQYLANEKKENRKADLPAAGDETA